MMDGGVLLQQNHFLNVNLSMYIIKTFPLNYLWYYLPSFGANILFMHYVNLCSFLLDPKLFGTIQIVNRCNFWCWNCVTVRGYKVVIFSIQF
jgi:hypothetical protein